MMPDNLPITPEPTDRALAFNREDFAVLAADFRRRMNDRVDKLLAVGVIAGLLIGAGLLSIADARGWPHIMQPVSFGIGWGLALIPAGIWRVRQKRILRSSGLICGGCGKPLVDTFRIRGRGEIVLATGECPSCGSPVFPTSSR